MSVAAGKPFEIGFWRILEFLQWSLWGPSSNPVGRFCLKTLWTKFKFNPRTFNTTKSYSESKSPSPTGNSEKSTTTLKSTHPSRPSSANWTKKDDAARHTTKSEQPANSLNTHRCENSKSQDSKSNHSSCQSTLISCHYPT